LNIRYTHPEKLGTNEYNCSKCGKTGQEATKQLSMKVLPPVLSFQLKVYWIVPFLLRLLKY
jgi:ubiquitin carboxyl-terminal hydrolase 22/27/51